MPENVVDKLNITNEIFFHMIINIMIEL